jgi:SpoVK/Ycf46/Vps4 family AAA+-type ATPase
VGLGWEDLVLPPETREVLQEILAHGRHREQVFDEWGFRDKLPYGRGLSCLFSGPPGTGKTLTAGILARMWGRPLFRIDLSRITSKWVGETEKNLASLFREAERAQVILLFDEADSIFSSRTEVKSSNDKYANLEVNYLLQRMENYDGVTLLTTNFEQSIDEAFKRRIRFKVYFPFPDEQARALLWRSSFPKKVPLEADIDWEALAAQHEMSGGNIKNASLRAAFYAVQEGARVSMEHLERAAMAEAREMGRLIRA